MICTLIPMAYAVSAMGTASWFYFTRKLKFGVAALAKHATRNVQGMSQTQAAANHWHKRKRKGKKMNACKINKCTRSTKTSSLFPKRGDHNAKMDRVKRIWYLSPMRAAKVQASLRIRAVSPEPPLLAHTGSESRGTFRQKARSLAPLNGWACAVKLCHDGMLEDTNSLDGAQMTEDKEQDKT